MMSTRLTTLLVAAILLGLRHTSLAGGVHCALRYYKISDTNVVQQIKMAKQPHLDQRRALRKRASTLPKSDAAPLRLQAYSHHCKADLAAIAILQTHTPSFTRKFYVPANGTPVRKTEQIDGKRLSYFVRTRPGIYDTDVFDTDSSPYVDVTYSFKYGKPVTSGKGLVWTTGASILWEHQGYMVLERRIAK